MKTHKLQTNDYLKGCASFLAQLKPFMNLSETAQGIECKMILANGKPITVTGKDEPHLLLCLMTVLVELLPDMCNNKQLEVEPANRAALLNSQPLEATMQLSTTTKGPSEHSIPRRQQIGVTTKVSQYGLVKKIAKKRGVPISTAARDLLKDALERFDSESMKMSPTDLLTNYEREANNYDGAKSESWIIRADRRLVMKTRLRAGEYNYSLSSFVNFILANELNYNTVADTINKESSLSLNTNEIVINACKIIQLHAGVKAKHLAPQIELGDQRGLTNMILGGTVRAPTRVLSKLASALNLPIEILSAALKHRFETQNVPAFKATECKPSVQANRKSWGVAVRELKLSTKEQKRLLDLDN
ncbi:hypothetical protein [Pseudoalteromonas arctica]|uniref:hypothetical protein n=1 Tax=Pseudoalteromonas arctica TaxID=394751 RepID=UPI002494C8B1|nr:hypothetical protein [Pseudoalteromonas arctica]